MTITGHFPAFAVVLPLLAAPIIAVIRHRHTAWVIALIVCWAAFGMSVHMLITALSSGPFSYVLGGWEPPIGIEYRIDVFNAFILSIVSGVGALCAIYARASVDREIAHASQTLFYTMYLLVIAGLMGITITGDAFNAFVFLEIAFKNFAPY